MADEPQETPLVVFEGEDPRDTAKRREQVRLQWQEPVGEYHVPETPRFEIGLVSGVFDLPLSKDPAIEIIHRFGTGWSGIHYEHVLFRYQGQVYAFRFEMGEEKSRDGVWNSWRVDRDMQGSFWAIMQENFKRAKACRISCRSGRLEMVT